LRRASRVEGNASERPACAGPGGQQNGADFGKLEGGVERATATRRLGIDRAPATRQKRTGNAPATHQQRTSGSVSAATRQGIR
jgi:hypothetical protein